MSISIVPTHGQSGEAKPKKNLFGPANNLANRRDEEKTGVFVGELPKEGLASAVASIAKGAYYKGPLELKTMLAEHHLVMSGDHAYKTGQFTHYTGATFGFIGQVARRSPPPVLFDDPEIAKFMFGESTPTACMDSSGRSWYWAPFLSECIDEDARGRRMTFPLMAHEYAHAALEHSVRMHDFPRDISSWAKDAVINPMIKILLGAGNTYSPVFSQAWGNAPEHIKYKGLAEETIGKMMLQERQKALEDLGEIHIKKLIVVDGPVRSITQLKAERDEVKQYDTVTVRVQDMGMMDKVDHEFICANLIIDEIDNQLKTRNRPGMESSGKSKQDESPIQIPTQAKSQGGEGSKDGRDQSKSDSDNEANGDPSSDGKEGRKSLDEVKADQKAKNNSSEQQGGKPETSSGSTDQGAQGSPSDVLSQIVRSNPMNGAGHEIDVGKLHDWLKATGRDSMIEELRVAEKDDGQLRRIIEVSLNEADKERLIIGQGYAGGHINDHMHAVVKPSVTYNVHWKRQMNDFFEGAGSIIQKSMDEYHIYTYLDPEDLRMPADENVYLEGNILAKPDERVLFIIDSSGSMLNDPIRIGHALAFAVGTRATQDDLAPDIDITSADTVVRGTPKMYDNETILDAIEKGVPLGGGGGTNVTDPINQVLLWAAKNDIVYRGIAYLTDFEVEPPNREDLPENLPPLMWLGMPHDYARAEHFISKSKGWSSHAIIENNTNYDLSEADEKAKLNADRGHRLIQP